MIVLPEIVLQLLLSNHTDYKLLDSLFDGILSIALLSGFTILSVS